MNLSCDGWILSEGTIVKVANEENARTGVVVEYHQTDPSTEAWANVMMDDILFTFPSDQLEFADMAEFLINYMPDEMKNAYRNKTHCEWSENYDSEWTPYYCDSCDSWHKKSYYREYEVDESGVLWMHVKSCDEDGNHDIEHSVEVLDDEYEEVESEYFNAETMIADWDEYLEWVAENGKDPLDELTFGMLSNKESVDFKIKVKWHPEVVELLSVLNMKTDMTYEKVNETDWSLPLSELIDDVRFFLCLKKDNEDRWLIAQDDLSNEDIKNSDSVKWLSEDEGQITIDVNRPVEITEEMIKAKAKECIEYREKLQARLNEKSKEEPK